MKKILALLLTVAMVACLFAGCQSSEPNTSDPATEPSTDNSNTDPATEPATEPANADNTSPDANGAKKVAFVTDVGNIDDHSFNQYSYEGVTKFCSNAGLECSYYKPVGDTDQDRIDAINQAVGDGYGVVVMAGYLFGPACYTVATQHPEVLFLALDVTEGDLKADTVPSNIALICYQEEQAGYLAGYAAVQEGYKELGFLGGIDVPAVVRYGYGFIMGADKAAQELNLTDVNIKYWYSGSFQPNDDIATKMDNWYVGGNQVVFACGGGIYLSCQSAAEANDGKMIGVDVDQSNVSDRIITSAMKALSNSVVKALTDASANGWTWPQNYAGVCQYLGAADNCVGLPMETSQFTTFTQEQYDTLFQAMANGSLVVDNNSNPDVKPAPQELQDKHYYRKHGVNAYYGQR